MSMRTGEGHRRHEKDFKHSQGDEEQEKGAGAMKQLDRSEGYYDQLIVTVQSLWPLADVVGRPIFEHSRNNDIMIIPLIRVHQ